MKPMQYDIRRRPGLAFEFYLYPSPFILIKYFTY
jgi:hypothetical protein